MPEIVIDVKRIKDDEPVDVVRLKGVSGVALVLQEEPDFDAGYEGVQFPVISMRVNSAAHATIILAGLIAACREMDPTVVPIALGMSQFAGAPIFRRELP